MNSENSTNNVNESTFSIFKDPSSFLSGEVCKNTKTKIEFNFIINSPSNKVTTLLITISNKKYNNIYYGYDSTAFCIIKNNTTQIFKNGSRYLIYGKIFKYKMYFIECLEADICNYKDLAYYLL